MNPGLPAVECNPGQVVNTYVPLSPSSITWYQLIGYESCRWEGNRRSGVALATRQTLVVLHLWAHVVHGRCSLPAVLAGHVAWREGNVQSLLLVYLLVIAGMDNS